MTLSLLFLYDTYVRTLGNVQALYTTTELQLLIIQMVILSLEPV